MISFFEADLISISVHHTGNKLLEEYFKLSNEPLKLNDEPIKNLLLQFFLKPFEKSNEVFNLYHPNYLHLNEVFDSSKEIFADSDCFHEVSERLTRLLYDVANHPKIKSGEFYVCLFDKVQIEGEQLPAIGLFKSETKDTYLKVFPEMDGFKIEYEDQGISINKLDKGCLIFNIDEENGFKVICFDQNKSDVAAYWKDEFLMLKIRNDNYTKTNNILSVFKNFVVHKMDDEYEINKTDKIDLLNRSFKYFKEKETFDLSEFNSEVIGNTEASDLFKSYKVNYETEYQTQLPDSFEISEAAVKSNVRAFKSELKLDNNFKITISGNKDLIQKGFDTDKNLNFYKLFYKEEN